MKVLFTNLIIIKYYYSAAKAIGIQSLVFIALKLQAAILGVITVHPYLGLLLKMKQNYRHDSYSGADL